MRLLGYFTSILGIFLYILLNWSYTTAVFTDPGSTLHSSGYSDLPTYETPSQQDLPSFTVKSTGEARFCKKCQARKPDRAHHCSTCKRCVLKMDHHCPWLATCVGLKNYKAFLLFLVYTTIFCWVCFAVTVNWVWIEIFSESQYIETLMPVNYVLLCLISGILGIIFTGFTAWHISLAWRGQTTIECLEKTRYLSPLRKTMRKQQIRRENGERSFGQQLAEIHANALPGVTRLEEGQEGDLEYGSPAQKSLRRTYNDVERSRERDRYEDYLDENDSVKLPNAFDLGWKRNMQHLLGEKPIFWFLPICNTTGDGWHWIPSSKWIQAREETRREREAQMREQAQLGSGEDDFYDDFRNSKPRYDQQRHYVAAPDERPNSRMSMKTLRRRESFGDEEEEDNDENRYDSSSDEDHERQKHNGSWYGQSKPSNRQTGDDEWREWERGAH